MRICRAELDCFTVLHPSTPPGSRRQGGVQARSQSQHYGQAEAPNALTVLDTREHTGPIRLILGSCGRAMPGMSKWCCSTSRKRDRDRRTRRAFVCEVRS
ncbi:unnamed protein product, partial [Mesorhabditis spiculigera]